ncbi:hypothetical protein GA0115258_111014 [Streptomyces sp. LamerLS-31b]|nr:hypothetical protein GA0115258_111014 [Streptomyces sp. LamerLS-31b]
MNVPGSGGRVVGLAGCPEVVQAQEDHRRLLRRSPVAGSAFEVAEAVTAWWWAQMWPEECLWPMRLDAAMLAGEDPQRWRILARGLVTYPEMVAVAGVLVDQTIRRRTRCAATSLSAWATSPCSSVSWPAVCGGLGSLIARHRAWTDRCSPGRTSAARRRKWWIATGSGCCGRSIPRTGLVPWLTNSPSTCRRWPAVKPRLRRPSNGGAGTAARPKRPSKRAPEQPQARRPMATVSSSP